MKNVKMLAAGTLAAGMVAIAVGGSFFASEGTARRPEKTFADYMRDAELYMDNGDYYKAIVSYENALSGDERNVEALAGMASAYARQANYEEEAKLREQIAEISPEQLDNQIRLVELLIYEKEYDTAKKRVEELMAVNDSEDLTSLYREMNVETPVFNLASGSYEDYQLLQLMNEYNNALVYYTVDGTEPNTASSVYADGIVISYPETVLRAKAVSALGYESEEVRLEFAITRAAESIPVSRSDIYNIANDILQKPWNSEVYDYELAQVRKVYRMGNYEVQSEPENAVFYDGAYQLYSSRHTDLGTFTLDFIKYTPFLQTLSVGYQESLDLTPLAGLRYIENLSLLNDGITDISPLEGLISLKKLALGWNQISDITPLAGLTELESLGLWNNEISDISALGGLSGLTYFDIAYNHVSQVEIVAGMAGLKELWLNHNEIQDLSPLDGCPGLVVLMQKGNPVSEFGTVKERIGQFYQWDFE